MKTEIVFKVAMYLQIRKKIIIRTTEKTQKQFQISC